MKEIHYSQLQFNPFDLVGKEWMLITAGNESRGYNTMTASWGHLGTIWGHSVSNPTAVIYVRPQRYTKEFVDREAYFTLCFFDEKYHKALGYLGSHSGRDGDKVKHVGMTPVFAEDTTYFAEAKLVLVCRKLYQQTLKEECFVDHSVVEDCYPKRDFHDLYIGSIAKVLVAE